MASVGGIAKNGDPLALSARPAANDDGVQARLLCRLFCGSLGVFDRIDLRTQRAEDMPVDNDLPPVA